MKKACPPHEFRRVDTGDPATSRDECHHCGISFREWAKGFGSNVRPKRVVR